MIRACLVSTTIAVVQLWVSAASAQPATSGSIRGLVRDETGQPLVGAVVVAASPALQGTQGSIVDEGGAFHIANLPPGTYTLTASYATGDVTRTNVLVRLGKVSSVTIDYAPREQAGEVIVIQGRAPTIDLGSAKTGLTLDHEDAASLPVGRTFTELAEAAPGAQTDANGVSFYGSTSPENAYLVDGFNATGVGYGEPALSLPNEFLTETEVITGAYGAEFGRATGGILNVVTKSGGNEFHGSVYGFVTPGVLAAGKREIPDEASALTFQRSLGYAADGGAELGGPILHDVLWFHVGFNPSYEREEVDRVVSRLVDQDGDGAPDAGSGGFSRTEELDRRTIALPRQTYHFTSKLSYAASPDHRGSLSVFGNPHERHQLFDDFAVGPDETMMFDRTGGAIDAVARWNSDFFDKAGQLEANVGFHRDQDRARPLFSDGQDPAVRFLYPRALSDFGAFEAVPDGCVDGSAADPYPMIENCPVMNYQVGGVDFIGSERRRRVAGRLSYRHVVDLGGRHELKAGVDIEDNRMESVKMFSGGTRWWDLGGGAVARFQFTTPDDAGAPCGADLDGDGVPDGSCSPQRRLVADAATLNTGAFAQDSYSPLPNLTINAGLRWERQALGAAEQVAGQMDPFTGAPIETTPLVLNALVAPRLGVVYDWSGEGRSRAFANWGRYYESIPLDLNVRGMGGEIFDIQIFDATACRDPLAPASYGCDAGGALFGFQQGGNKLVAPGLQGQHSDELVAGLEYELLENFTVGATYIRRVLKNAIEDVTPNGDSIAVLANPGQVDEDAVADLRAEADAARASGDAAQATRLDYQADLFEGVGAYPRPVRRYNALELTAAKRFSAGFMVRASYTFSKLRGNYPGLFSPDTGQLDPNFTTMYDFADTMVNRYGDLPHDRPHQFKIDGTYHLEAGPDIGGFLFGGRLRGASGRPHSYLGMHPIAGPGEVFILPRGTGERAPFQSAVDVRLGYDRPLAGGTSLEVFLDVFNLFNQQPATRLDEIYTYDPVEPIRGGKRSDLADLTTPVYGPDGTQTGTRPVAVNPNYGNPIATQDPLSMRIGVRLSF
jgi:hypothetical protein